jgi:hypothetical protein
MDPYLIQKPGDPHLFLVGKNNASSLLAVAKGSVIDLDLFLQVGFNALEYKAVKMIFGWCIHIVALFVGGAAGKTA